MSHPMRRKFREMLNSGEMIVAPGIYDGLTGRLVEAAGFSAAYMTGAGTSMRHGLPDYGLMTMTEMVENAASITETLGIPLIADCDTGYGNALNVTRAVQCYERAGVAAVHIEDQGFPKKCGHLDDKVIIPVEQFTTQIKAAVAARQDEDFVIIARTDSRAPIGFDEAIMRANAALDAGADVAFVEAPQTMDEIKAVTERVHGPCLFNLVFGGKTPETDLKTVADAGFAISILPDLLLREVISSCETVLQDAKQGRLPDALQGLKVRQLFERVGSKEWDDVRGRFDQADVRDAAE